MTSEKWELLFGAATAIGAIASALMLILAFFQLRCMRIGIDDARKWNKMSTSFSIYPSNSQLSEIEEKLNSSFLNLVDRNLPITSEEVSKLFEPDNGNLRVLLKTYLNELESYCAAINMGVVHEDVAKRKYSHKIKRYYQELKPYIDHMRSVHNEPQIMSELETVAMKWVVSKEKETRY